MWVVVLVIAVASGILAFGVFLNMITYEEHKLRKTPDDEEHKEERDILQKQIDRNWLFVKIFGLVMALSFFSLIFII